MLAVGAGHDPDPIPLARPLGADSTQHSPSRSKPHGGQIPEYGIDSPSSEHWGILHEDKSWSYFANDPCHFPPEPASGAVDTGPLNVGAADILAGESTRDDIDVTPPVSAIEGSDIVPYGEVWKNSVALTSEEDASAEGINLNSADGAPAKEVSSQDASSCPSK